MLNNKALTPMHVFTCLVPLIVTTQSISLSGIVHCFPSSFAFTLPVTLSLASVDPPLLHACLRSFTRLDPFTSTSALLRRRRTCNSSNRYIREDHGAPKVTREQLQQGDGRRCWSASISASDRRRVPTRPTAPPSSFSDHLS